ALEPLFADVRGKTILDVGCGEGRYARKLKARGAKLTGIDPVPAFVEHARSLDSESRYVVGTAASLPFEDDSFDLVLSYLSLVDIVDLETAAAEMTRVLRCPGKLVIVTLSNLASTTTGWVKDAHGKKLYRKVYRYMEEFALDLEWRGIAIRNYHRPLSQVLGGFLERGLVLTGFAEPLPDPADPNYAEEYCVPTFQILTLEKIQTMLSCDPDDEASK
ncbi:MAG: class I SAM-dependent methyltransferase, partial [Myxococcota bacterium]